MKIKRRTPMAEQRRGRRHHNRTGTRQAKNGKLKRQVERLTRRLVRPPEEQ